MTATVIAESVRDNPLCPVCKSPSYYDVIAARWLADEKAAYEVSEAARRSDHEKKIANRDGRGEFVAEEDREYHPVPFVPGNNPAGPYARLRTTDLRNNGIEKEIIVGSVDGASMRPRDYRQTFCDKCGCVWVRHIEIVRG